MSPTPQKTGRKPTNPVYEFFNYDEELDESRCVISGCRRKKVAGNHGGNLEKHIKRHHKDKVAVLERRKAEVANTSTLLSRKKTKTPVLSVSMTPRLLKLACVRLVAVHGRPMELMNDAAFQDIVRPLLDAMPARQRFAINDETVRTMIRESARLLKEHIKKEVAGKMVSLKVDSTTKGGVPYFGINIQFSKNGIIQLRTLAVKQLYTRQTAGNLNLEVVDALNEYDIPTSNVISFTCDNGANMLRAADLLREAQSEALCDEEQEELELQLQCPEEDGDGGILSSVKCSAHTLQLAVMDDSLKKSPAELRTLQAARDLVKILRTENNKKLLKRSLLPVPVLDNMTRWNTSYIMLDSLKRIEKFIRDEELVSDELWSAFESLIQSLEPAMKTTKAFQSAQLTLGDMYGMWLGCKIQLKKVNSPLSLKIEKAMTARERQQVYARSSAQAGQEKSPSLFEYPGFLGALYLDPRYFTCLSEEEVHSAKTFLRKLWLRLQKKNNNQQIAVVQEDNSVECDEIEIMLREKDVERTVTAGPACTNINSQIEAYYRETSRVKDRKTSVLKWSEDHKLIWPELYIIAIILHAIPATQVSVERLFSALKFIMHYLRSGLAANMIEDLTLIHSNSNLVKEDILLLMDIIANPETQESDSDLPTASSSSSSLPTNSSDV